MFWVQGVSVDLVRTFLRPCQRACDPIRDLELGPYEARRSWADQLMGFATFADFPDSSTTSHEAAARAAHDLPSHSLFSASAAMHREFGLRNPGCVVLGKPKGKAPTGPLLCEKRKAYSSVVQHQFLILKIARR